MKVLHRPGRAVNSGATLIVGLIMLVLLTLVTIAAFRLGNVQTVVVSNAQQQIQGVAAAQQAIDTVVNSSNFTKNPAAAITTSNCAGGGNNVLCVSRNGTSTNDFKVTISPNPSCINATPIPAQQLDLSAGAASADLACLSGPQQNQFAISGATSGNSNCATSLWEVSAQATDINNDTNVVNVTEGIGTRILTIQIPTYCP